MPDTDRLAALESAIHYAECGVGSYHDLTHGMHIDKARAVLTGLEAAGVTLAPTPCPCHSEKEPTGTLDWLAAEALIADALRATARRYGMAPGVDAIDYFPHAEVWATRIAAHLANHGYGFLDAERARHAALVEAADTFVAAHEGSPSLEASASFAALRAALIEEARNA
jgi:hypothetical protein